MYFKTGQQASKSKVYAWRQGKRKIRGSSLNPSILDCQRWENKSVFHKNTLSCWACVMLQFQEQKRQRKIFITILLWKWNKRKEKTLLPNYKTEVVKNISVSSIVTVTFIPQGFKAFLFHPREWASISAMFHCCCLKNGDWKWRRNKSLNENAEVF